MTIDSYQPWLDLTILGTNHSEQRQISNDQLMINNYRIMSQTTAVPETFWCWCEWGKIGGGQEGLPTFSTMGS